MNGALDGDVDLGVSAIIEPLDNEQDGLPDGLGHIGRRAIERLGAKLDGVLRQHRRMPNGTLRDTCVYSIIASEWPGVRANLEGRLDAADIGRFTSRPASEGR